MAVAKMRRKKKKWAQDAVKNPGAFTAYCKSLGFKGVTNACIEKGIAAGGAVAKRAVLARTLRRMHK